MVGVEEEEEEGMRVFEEGREREREAEDGEEGE